MSRSQWSRGRAGVVLGAVALAIAVLVGLTAPPARATTPDGADPGIPVTGPTDPYAGRPSPTTTVVVGPVPPPVEAPPPLELTRFGLWVADDPDASLQAGESTLDHARDLLGEPDETTLYAAGLACVDAHGVDSGAKTTVASGVRWGDLTLFFDGALVFQSYRYGPSHTDNPVASTSGGITLGSTVTDLKAAYGEELLIEDEATSWGHVWYQRGLAPGIGGFVTGPTDEDTVTVIHTGGCFRTLSGETPPVDGPDMPCGLDDLLSMLHELWGWLEPLLGHFWPDDPAAPPADEPTTDEPPADHPTADHPTDAPAGAPTDPPVSVSPIP